MANIIREKGIDIPAGSHEGKRIILCSDHRGFGYKEEFYRKLMAEGWDVSDIGTYSPERCDYPPISSEMGRLVGLVSLNTAGIGICGSGIGIIIPASKYEGAYAARCLSPDEAITSRKHNNTNILGLGADCISLEKALETMEAWLKTPFCSDPEKEKAYLDRYIQTVRLERNIR